MHEAFLAEIRAILGDETPAFLAEMDRPYAHTLRLNPFRENAEEAASPFTEGAVEWCADGRYYRNDTRPGLSPLHFAGAYYIQEASAMAPAMALDAQPGDRVLDLCAAPGGKSGQLAAALRGEGLLISNEPEPSRAKILSATMERLGVSNSIVVNSLPEKLSPVLPEFFDKILVDAPCSGEGMFRRDPATRSEWTPASPAGCASRQAFILDHAAKMLRPGGRMAYSTCTFNRAENEETIAAFLGRHPDFRPVSFSLPGIGESENGCLRLWPHRLRGEGHFLALMEKTGEPERDSARPKSARPDKEVQAAVKMLLDIAPGLKTLLDRGEVVRAGEILKLVPSCAPELKGVKVVRHGLHLCRIGKNYVEPDHALCMALHPSDVSLVREVTDEEALPLLTGETLPSDARGWLMFTYKNMPLGWGKASGGVAKNHIPKGLRIQR
ncbi:MAG: RsmF rRNA methyltransferase first C-terminal domain-containing protein [Clostridia bacterium]|nr:RsmF rRNA methyltransferase first C-terminal domain-containing protein [Clostridia bacterium]